MPMYPPRSNMGYIGMGTMAGPINPASPSIQSFDGSSMATNGSLFQSPDGSSMATNATRALFQSPDGSSIGPNKQSPVSSMGYAQSAANFSPLVMPTTPASSVPPQPPP